MGCGQINRTTALDLSSSLLLAAVAAAAAASGSLSVVDHETTPPVCSLITRRGMSFECGVRPRCVLEIVVAVHVESVVARQEGE